MVMGATATILEASHHVSDGGRRGLKTACIGLPRRTRKSRSMLVASLRVCDDNEKIPPDENPAGLASVRVLPLTSTRLHFRAVPIELKFVLSAEPTPFTAVMIAIAMPAAIKPYSIAVAPD
jgi:hypothetical protein